MFRALLPAPALPRKEQDGDHPPGKKLPKRRQHFVAAACGPCRRRKIRCDGTRPHCWPCQQRGLACEYHTGPGETVLEASKRKTDELQQKSDTYEELFRLIATMPQREAVEVVGMIQSGHSAQALLRHIQTMPAFLVQEGNPYLDSWLYKYSSLGDGPRHNDSSIDHHLMYQIPYHATQIIDPRLNALKAKPWTSVTDDDALLTELVQTYLLTVYTWYPSFQKDYFLQDMATGGQRYCSPMLVNAILASACNGYLKMKNRAQFWNPKTLGYLFLAEARRLWELEAGSARLTTIQAAIVLSIVYDANGSDRIGNSYLAQAVSAAQSIHLFSSTKVGDDIEHNARTITAWALFGLQAVHSFHVYKAPLLAQPPEMALPPGPETSDHYYGEFWLKYPSSERPIPVRYGNTFRAIAEFRVILNEVAATFFGREGDASSASISTIERLCLSLDSWYRTLPADLGPRAICFPWQLKLHMHYHNLTIYLLETLGMVSKRALSDLGVQKTLDDAKMRLETLLRLYYCRHGFESYDLFMTQLISFVGFFQIKALQNRETTEVESRRSTVILAAKGLQEQGRNCYLAELVFHVLKGRMGADMQRLLEGNTDIPSEDEEESRLKVEYVHSSWPIDIDWIEVDPEKQRLSNLIKETSEPRV